ncbi:MAG TPA: glycosyltransferase family 4 protein [Vicinamibacterales bacterium]|nr:glycosyltransferase family 4 protein [Vicinamibacterales bacterium]
MAFHSILLTPNFLGRDGVSALSREMSRALPTPSLVLSLHDSETVAGASPCDLELHSARGSRVRFLADVMSAMPHVTPDTLVVCSHLHLAPAARVLSWGGRPATIILCGIEAWVGLRPIEQWAVSRTEVVAISQHTVNLFRAANPALAAGEVTVCHPGLPAKSTTPFAHMTAFEFATSPTALIVARMSAAERYKGHDALLDVWPRLVSHHPNAVLVIVGDGDDRPRLEARVAALGITRAVRFLGAVDDRQLADLYRSCRLFAMPSRDEGFGLVFLEAMRAGKPCIGGRGAAAEIIEHGVTGLIVDPGSRQDLSAALERLYTEPDTCSQFGAAGRERFLSTFTSDCFQTRLLRVIGRRPLATLAASVP